MLTKIGVAALLGTIGTAVLGGGTAMAAEPCAPARVVVAPRPVVIAAPAPIVTPVSYGYASGYRGHDRRDEGRLERARREEAQRHAEWLRRYHQPRLGRW
jgi:hypothetical protein